MRSYLVASSLLAALLVTGAASCGARTCTPQSCPTGCCSAAGVCESGGENAACGSAGNACLNCTASSQVCGDKVCVAFATGGGGGEDAGAMDGGGATDAGFVCTRTPVECSDQAIQQLDLKMTVAPGLITNAADGTGFKSTIDATGGGFQPTESYVYARFTAQGLEKLPISDLTALDSMDWDIAFRRFVIRVNSGDSGPACAAGQVLAPGTTYESVSAVPSGFLPEGDDFLSRAPTCSFIDDGSGLGTSPRTLLSSFYEYTGCVGMTGRVYVLRSQGGRAVKLTVTTYYATEAAQQTCDDTGSSGGAAGGTMRVRWQFID
jgi:hypothetical protein